MPWGCGGRAIGGSKRPLHQNTSLERTALPTDTVTVTDPTHPLYTLTLPLIGITNKPRLGRVCVVWLYAGVERVIPIAATSLATSPLAVSPCRLSVEGLHALLTVVASWQNSCQEATYGDSACLSQASQHSTRPPAARVASTAARAATRRPVSAAPATLDEPIPHAASARASDAAAHHPGGTR